MKKSKKRAKSFYAAYCRVGSLFIIALNISVAIKESIRCNSTVVKILSNFIKVISIDSVHK